MAGGERTSLKRFILWDYPRAGWQYDLMVGLILAFIFLTPREWFRDQPRASSIVAVNVERGMKAYFIEPALLENVPPEQRLRRATELLKNKIGNRQQVRGLEPITNPEQELVGFMATVDR